MKENINELFKVSKYIGEKITSPIEVKHPEIQSLISAYLYFSQQLINP